MKYLIINHGYTYGGTEVQTKREFQDFISRGHEVRLITLDPQLGYRESKESGHINLTHPYSQKEMDYYRFFVDKKLLSDLEREIKAFKPDYIHLNNIFYSPIAVYKAVAPYRVFQTIRDYRILCPKNVCIHEDASTCQGCKFENCLIKCGLSNYKAIPKIILKKIAMKLQDRWRMKACNKFACPSQCLTNYCVRSGYDTVCINNPFDLKLLEGFSKQLDIKERKILLYGSLSKFKGIEQLLDSFMNIYDECSNLHLYIVGSIDDDVNKNLLKKALSYDRITYLGKKPYSEIIEILSSIYAVFVPSLWLENYPNTALEGSVTECVVCGSNRGGIPEFIVDERCKFDILDLKSIEKTLCYISKMEEKTRKKICEEQFKRVKSNNTQEQYYHNVMNLLKKIEK